ncbi:host specificity factor TipJ family phage tail protein [Halomonas sabkhae]|uniref:host specificity factor TipJ family phage tail protein n=1 Tax=Halomonas sabkhae TaxID=626223 RepID=UPI0025B2C9E3|nr:host specificity factor TipJ family phage tail protein [Halomonas sabkhae]MDN3525626.1 host specificity factor TipJ family phage tail protein [Halomonas sabkhae]
MTTIVAHPSPVRSDLYTAEIPDGTSLASVLGDVPESVRAQIDGEAIPRERWEEPLPADAQVLITATPEDDGIGRALAMVAIAVAAAYTGGAAAGAAGFAQGTAGYAAVSAATSAAVTMAGSLAVNALIPPEMPEQNNPGSATVRKSITGTRNQIDKYGVVPRVYGNPRWYPKLAANPVTEIAGNDQYMRMLLVLGYGPLEIAGNRVGAGHSVLRNAGVGDAITIGETNLDEYEDVEWEIGTPDQLSLMSPDIAEEQVGVALNKTGEVREHEWVADDVPPVVRTTAPNTREISMDLTFPAGLWVTTDNGKTRGCRVRYSIRYRRTGESAWTTLDDNWVIKDHTKETKRVNRRWTVPVGQYDVELTRVATYLRDDNSPQTDSTWAVLRSVQEGPAYTGDHLLMALRIRATDQLNGVIDQLRIRTQAVLRVWDGSAWTMQATSNPGWAYIDAMTGEQVGKPITDDRLHLEDIADWAVFCGDQNLEYHHVHDADETVLDRARSIAAGGQGSFAFRDGKFGIVFDDPSTPTVQAITPRNASGFSSSIQYKDLPHAIRVKYVDPDTWSDAERIVYRDGYDATNATRFEDFQLQGVASADEAWHHGQYHLRQAILRPETFSASMDWENLAIVRGNRVLYQYDAILVGLGSARVKSVSGTTIVLDERLEYTEQRAYGISVRGVDDAQGRAKLIASQVTGAEIGETDTFTTVDSIDVEPGDLVIYGVMGRESIDAKVSKIQPNQDFGADLTLVNAAPDIYDYSSAPIFDPGITLPIDPSNLAPPVPQITSVRGDETAVNVDPSGTPQPVLRVAYEFPTRGGYPALDVEARYRQDDQTQWDSFGPTSASGHMSIPGIADQVTYIVQLRSRRGDRYSDWSAEAASGVTGRPVAPPDGVDVEAGNFVITLRPYGPYPNALWEFYRSQASLAPENVESAAVRIGVGSQITDNGLQPDTTYYYYVRGWSASAVSAWYALQATTDLNISQIMDVISGEIRKGDLWPALQEEIDRIETHESEINDVQARADQLRSDLTAEVGRLDGRADALSGDLSTAVGRIDDIETDVGNAVDRITSVETLAESNEGAVNNLAQDVSTLEGRTDDAEASIIETQRIDELNGILEAVTSSVSSVQNAVGSASQSVETINRISEDGVLLQRQELLEGEFEDVDGRINDIVNLTLSPGSALLTRFGEIEGSVDNVNGRVTNVENLDISPDSALITRLNEIEGEAGNASGLAQDIVDMNLATDSALVSRFETIEGTVNDPDTGVAAAHAVARDIRQLNLSSATALVSRFETIEGNVSNAQGSIQDIQNLDLAPDSALIERFSTLEGTVNDPDTGVAAAHAVARDIRQLNLSSATALVSRFETIEGNVSNAQGSIQDIRNLNLATDSALIQRFESVEGSVGSVDGRVDEIINLDLATDSALIERFNTVEGSVSGVDGRIDDVVSLNFAEGENNLVQRLSNIEASAADGISAVRSQMEAELSHQSLVTDGSFSTGDGSLWNNTSDVNIIERDPNGSNVVAGSPDRYFAQFRNYTAGGNRHVSGQWRSASPGDSYTVKMDYSARAGTDGIVRISVQWQDASGNNIGWPTADTVSMATASDGAWRTTTPVSLTAPAGTTRGRVIVTAQETTSGNPVFTNVAASMVDSAMASRVDTVSAQASDNQVAIQTEETARIDEDSALAEQINTVQAQLGDDIASVEQQATAEIDTERDRINAMWTLRTDVNGHVAGIGLANDGQESGLAVRADRFYVAQPGLPDSEVIPFIVDGGNTYLRAAFIQEATIGRAKIADLAVNTFKIADQSVIIPVSSFTAARSLVPINNWGTLASATINPRGARVEVIFNFIWEARYNSQTTSDKVFGSDVAHMQYRLTQNGSEITSGVLDRASLGVVSFAWLTGVLDGNQTFRLEVMGGLTGDGCRHFIMRRYTGLKAVRK